MTKTIVTSVNGRVATIRLNRPDVLNALNSELLQELLDAAVAFDASPDIGCIVIAGNARAFAAGADIAELAQHDYASMYAADYFAGWDRFASLRTPKIAAVAGYALGGGCELAMMCDIIIAADTARFGQPEVKIGCIPGIGGTQRLTRLVGQARAMDMILTGRMIDAAEAERSGLVSRVVPADELEAVTAKTAETIAGYSKDVIMMARACVREAEEGGLAAGIRFERQMYHAIYGTHAQREGMDAFLNKRQPDFHGKVAAKKAS